MDTTEHCSGCENNFYNGNNPYGVERCWSLKDAKLVDRVRIHRDQVPPYRNVKPVRMLNCRHEKGYALVAPETIGKDGYWAR